MDSIYRGQRHIYDLTRKYYLFGRDRLIDGLGVPKGGSLLEIACGTGRNLDKIALHWPSTELFGLDISSEMLKSAGTRLGTLATLAQGDATQFDPQALFGRERFDRIILSYSLSMIPDWHGAVRQALELMSPQGELHIVDFGDMEGMPRTARSLLLRWLGLFHVTPRPMLAEVCLGLATRQRLQAKNRRGPMGYYHIVTIGWR
jgi:S-adenosylmethionine-diacylgycerolhomoserine-N-methlytransferase